MANTYVNRINSLLKQSSSFDEVLRASVKYAMETGNAEYAIVWLIDKSKKALVPYYWLCPLDLTNCIYTLTGGLLTNTAKKGLLISRLDYKKNDKKLDALLDGITITSFISIPLVTAKKTIGCISFINTREDAHFSQNNAKVFMALENAFAKSNFEFTDYKRESNDVVFSLKNIHKDFENGGIITSVLKGINLDVHAGEFLVLLGPSGCGKTTLLNIIGGMDNPSSGEIIFNDQDLTQADRKALTSYRRDNIGFVFQSYNLMPNLTAKQNLDLIGELVKKPLDSRFVLKLVGLEDKADNYPSQLSGGQQQRISIARALVKNPIAIMADEPTAALDYKTSIGVLEVLQNITTEGKTLIMVTHNEEIAKLANRVVRLRDGKAYEVYINREPARADELVW